MCAGGGGGEHWRKKDTEWEKERIMFMVNSPLMTLFFFLPIFLSLSSSLLQEHTRKRDNSKKTEITKELEGKTKGK